MKRNTSLNLVDYFVAFLKRHLVVLSPEHTFGNRATFYVQNFQRPPALVYDVNHRTMHKYLLYVAISFNNFGTNKLLPFSVIWWIYHYNLTEKSLRNLTPSNFESVHSKVFISFPIRMSALTFMGRASTGNI